MPEECLHKALREAQPINEENTQLIVGNATWYITIGAARALGLLSSWTSGEYTCPEPLVEVLRIAITHLGSKSNREDILQDKYPQPDMLFIYTDVKEILNYVRSLENAVKNGSICGYEVNGMDIDKGTVTDGAYIYEYACGEVYTVAAYTSKLPKEIDSIMVKLDHTLRTGFTVTVLLSSEY
ncbi:hypothetical protein [Pyrodictium abyssi]|uniref:Uncharacterized protein n=1 Tax=Pyrodictium abyssi TaxID=54256 RepID=A0ABM8J141_9CREN|nr:hypothetical protein PABY_24190 [Pyrodictium abyssi]